ncbi:MAG TPA: translocation/assembly module TamB domain-containing protein [Acidobacteriaceae bacterium]
MTDEIDQPDDDHSSTPHPPPAKKRRSLFGHISRATAWIIVGVLTLIVLLVAGVSWYTTTENFRNYLSAKIVSVLEDATGGRVEVGALEFSLWHLAIDVNGFVIHGLEAPGEAPYLSADAVRVRLGITSFFSRASGPGVASHIRLKLLRVEHPQFHLIIDKDGHTNQPVPKHPSTSTEPLQDTLLDLHAKEAQVSHGVALINDRAIPFEMAARDLNTEVVYLRTTDRYGIRVDLNDLRTKMAQQPEAQSRLHIEGELGRDVADLTKFEFDSGKSSVLHATATLHHFAQPDWLAAANGTLELKQVAVLTGTDGLTGGTADLVIRGHSCAASPAAQPAHHSWLHKNSPASAKPGAQSDPECKTGFVVSGRARLHGAGYANDGVRVHDVDGGAQIHITPTQLLLSSMAGYLPGGGYATGDLRIENWLAPAPPTPAKTATKKAAVSTANNIASSVGARAPVQPSAKVAIPVQHAYLVAQVNAIPLRTIMEATETHGYGDLGFDAAVTGPVNVEWGTSSAEVVVDGDLKFRPTGTSRRGALDNVPVTGEAVAHYDGRRELVTLQHVILLTPQSSTEVTGILGVSDGDPLTNLKADMTVRDLGEFDQLLQTLNFEANGKKGTAAIPVVLHGGLIFHGTVSGRSADLDWKGHLQGTQLEVKFGDQLDTLVDSLVTDAEYSFDEGLFVANSTIKRGEAVLNVSGSMKPRKIVSRRGVPDFIWDGGTAVNASVVQLNNASIVDMLQIAGQQDKLPVTGTIAVNARASGTLDDLNGDGKVTLTHGVAYGEPYDSASANLSIQGHQFDANQVTLVLHGARVTGNVGYNLDSKSLRGHIQGDNLELSKFTTFAKARPGDNGILTINAEANGTIEQPGLKASLKLAKVSVGGKILGDVSADVHSQDSLLLYTAQSKLVGAQVDASGQTRLTGDYDTQAKLSLSGLDIGTLVALFSPGKIKAQSSLAGTITLSGPLGKPTALSGLAQLNAVDVKLEGVELKTAEPLHLALKNGFATLDPLHITGQDTDMTVGGTVQAFGGSGSNDGKLDAKANGSISMALMHTLDPDILSSGKVEFTIAAAGQVSKPSLTGKVQFDNVNAAMDGVPNGLSALNGTLIFNEDRLQVETLTATTGGGQIKIGGFLSYKNGVYANLTATGDVVRVRLYGLSTTANTNLALQGSAQNLLLSGNVLITRFGVGPDVDFAAFSSIGGVSTPPEPNAASNKITMNVHVTSSPQLDFQNTYAKLAGTVDLTVGGTVANPSILGRIQITDGSATFAGTKYQLQRGDIYFSNPVRIDPTIDINATARVETYDVTVGLQGTMSNLKPTYRSEPPLSEADIFALLALGRTQEEAQLYQEQQVQQGANPTTSALLGGALNATVSSRIGKLFGGGTVKIDPAFVGTLGNSTARITVQKQLSRQLGVTYATNVNSTAQQLLQGQYDLTPNVSLVVARDESGVFSVVYKIRRRYR